MSALTKRGAIAAVRDLYTAKPVTPDGHEDPGDLDIHAHHEREDRARRLVTGVIRRGKVTAASIAAGAGVRQLLVARLIEDDRLRAEALAAAHRDALRYADEVRDALRTEAIRSIHGGMGKSRAAERYGVSRVTLDKWLADD